MPVFPFRAVRPSAAQKLGATEKRAIGGVPDSGVPDREGSAAFKPPFLLELRCEDIAPTGTFTPSALLALTPALLEGSLWRVLTSDEVLTLLLVLCCVTPNGNFEATPQRLALALGLQAGVMRQRLLRLTAIDWNGTPLLTTATTESGLERFWPSPFLLEVRQRTLGPPPPSGSRVQPVQAQSASAAPTHLTRREEVIAHSRAAYTRPRAEVEAEIEEFLRPVQKAIGTREKRPPSPLPVLEDQRPKPSELIAETVFTQPVSTQTPITQVPMTPPQSLTLPDSAPPLPASPPIEEAKPTVGTIPMPEPPSTLQAPTPPASTLPASTLPTSTLDARNWHALKRRLVGFGLSEERASSVLESYPAERIERQMEWLPYRHARNAAFYLIAAIKDDYAPPAKIALQNLPPVEKENTPSSGAPITSPPSDANPDHIKT